MERLQASVVFTDASLLNESLHTANLDKVTRWWPKLPKHWGYR